MEHLRSGAISKGEFILFLEMICNADPASGTWESSAEELSRSLSVSPRTCRDQMESLERKGYIKRFQVPGKNGSYPILVNKFECSDGAMKGSRVNAKESASSKHPIYDECRDAQSPSAGTVPPSLKRLREEKPRVRAGLPPTPIPRHTPRDRPSDAAMAGPPVTPDVEDAMMAIASKRVAEGKAVDAATLRNVRAWEQQQLKKKGPVSVEARSQREVRGL